MITNMYLTRDAKLGQQTCLQDDENANKPKIETFGEYKKGIEGSIPTFEDSSSCKGSIEWSHEIIWWNLVICCGHQEHVQSGQTF